MSERTSKRKRSREARTRGANPTEPMNRPDADTPGFYRRSERLTYSNLRGEDRERMLETVREMTEAGATLFELAHAFQVTQNTVLSWSDRDPGFAAALQPMTDAMVDRVERSLYHKAVGYSFPAEKIHFDADGNVTRARYIEHMPPDNGAIVFFLKNRAPEKWRDKFDHNVSGSVEVTSDNVDPRKLAMAVLDLLRDAHDAPQEIEHGPQEGEDDDT